MSRPFHWEITIIGHLTGFEIRKQFELIYNIVKQLELSILLIVY